LVCFLGSHISKWSVGGYYSLPTLLVVGRKAATLCRWAHRTEHCSLSGAFHVTRPLDLTVATLRPLGTPDSPLVHRKVRCDLMTVSLADVAGADCAADRWTGVRLAQRTIRCTSNNTMIYSRNAPNCFPRAACSPRAGLGTGHCPVHTGQSGAPRLVQLCHTRFWGQNRMHSICVLGSIFCNTSGVTMTRAHLCTNDYDHMWKKLKEQSVRALEARF
jgi:hypothetical protein